MISVHVASHPHCLRSDCFRTPSLSLWRRVALGALLVGCFSSGIAADSIKADLSLGRIAKPETAVSRAGDDEARALAHFAAAQELEEEGRLRGALQHYREAVKASPHDIALTQRTAELALTFEGRDAAIGLLNDNIKANPTSSAAIINLARFLVTYPDEAGKSAEQVNKVLAEALTSLLRG